MRDVSAGTCGGRITCNFLRNYCVVDDEAEEEGEEDQGDGEDDPLFVYEEITSFLISLRPQIIPQQGTTKIDVIEPKLLPLRSSLFHHVSPYLQFQHGSSNGTNLPLELTKRLKWKLTAATPKIVRRIVTSSGWVASECPIDWCGSWCDAMFAINFQYIKNFQKINHFPGAYEIGNKDRLCRNLRRLVSVHGGKRFDFVPDTYVLPEDLPKIRGNRYQAGRGKWIVKPPGSSCGRGIFLIAEFAKIPSFVGDRKMIVQRYLSRPKLINGTKFDLRVYALVTSFDPLRIYVYREGLARFACDPYRNSPSSLDNRFMHLTNYSVNRACSRYRCNDSLETGKGHKWSLGYLWTYLNDRGVDTDRVLRKINDMIIKTIVACESSINSFTRVYMSSKYCCYELLGFDVLLDENAKPWLLEVNVSPSLQTSSALDEAVKGPLVRDTLNIVGYQVPANFPCLSSRHFQPKRRHSRSSSTSSSSSSTSPSSICQNNMFYEKELSRSAKRKHTRYIGKWSINGGPCAPSILDNLTPDDVRHLMRYEDELVAIGNFEKIFPTLVSRKYFKYFEKVTYYNLLFDAWERAYGSDDSRESGIARLRNLSDVKYHLIDPKGEPTHFFVPVRNDAERSV